MSDLSDFKKAFPLTGQDDQSFSQAAKDWRIFAQESLKGVELEKVLCRNSVEGVKYQGLYSQRPKTLDLFHFPDKVLFSRLGDSGLARSEDIREDMEQGLDERVLIVRAKRWSRGFEPGLNVSFILQKTKDEILEEFKGASNVYVDCNQLDFTKFDQEIERVKKTGFGFLINASDIHNAGASAVQEISYCLNLFSALLENGVHPQNVKVMVACDSLCFLNVAKLRALRFLVEELLDAQGVDKNFFLIAASSLREQTLYDPWVNVLRNSASAMAALFGGANQIAVRAHESLYSLLTDEPSSALATRTSRNILNIAREESQLDFVKDPSKGSFAVEALSVELARLSWENFLSWREDNFFHQIKDFSKSVEAIAKSRWELVRKRKKVVTGVNDFANPEETLESLYKRPWRPVETPSGLFPLRRTAFEFEELRIALEKSGKPLKVALFWKGRLSSLSARMNFIQNIFETLGAQTMDFDADKGVAAAARAAQEEGCSAAVFCGLDKEYGEWVRPQEASSFKKLFIAGDKGNFEIEQAQKVSDLHVGKNIYSELKSLLREEGMLPEEGTL